MNQFFNTQMQRKKPWGFYTVIYSSDKNVVKIIMVNPHSKISLQSHKYHDESWTILEGTANIICGDIISSLSVGETVFISRQKKHRLSNDTNIPLIVLESSFGDIIEEEDITRYEDIYNRK